MQSKLFRIVPFEPWHGAIEINLVETYDQENWRRHLIDSYHQGPTYTGFYGDHTVGFGGIRKYWNGVGEGWIMINQERPDVPSLSFVKMMVKEIKEVLKNEIFVVNGYWRIHAYCHHATPNAGKLLKAIGFKLEGILKRFNPDGTDSNLYSLVKE